MVTYFEKSKLFDPFEVLLIKKISNDEYFKKNAQFTYVSLEAQPDFAERLLKSLNVAASESNKSKRNHFSNKVK